MAAFTIRLASQIPSINSPCSTILANKRMKTFKLNILSEACSLQNEARDVIQAT